ncbi:tetratricopeptide repeat protein [Wenzhouxiangellaceae bacterium CH-27]|uniref:Tetratricopeptide repeat protein n=1 Tax=Elongatibacter sediminis TaxID=3119006 RepID=A0AAW9RKN5_9GAMM
MALALVALAGGPVARPAVAHPDLLAQIAQLDSEIALNPEDVGAYLRRADLHRRHVDYDAAEADVEQARLLTRADRATHGAFEPAIDRTAGRLALDQERFTAAVEYLGRSLASRPADPAAWRFRGLALQALGRHEEAAGDFAQAIDRTAQPPPDLYRLRARALTAVGPDGWTRARDAADRGLERHPGDPALRGLATDLALVLGDVDGAGRYLDELPAPILGLAVWKTRVAARGCLNNGADRDDGASCTASIRIRLSAEHGAVDSPHR